MCLQIVCSQGPGRGLSDEPARAKAAESRSRGREPHEASLFPSARWSVGLHGSPRPFQFYWCLCLKMGERGAWEIVHGRLWWGRDRGRVESRGPSTQPSPLPMPLSHQEPSLRRAGGQEPRGRAGEWGLTAGEATPSPPQPTPVRVCSPCIFSDLTHPLKSLPHAEVSLPKTQIVPWHSPAQNSPVDFHCLPDKGPPPSPD